MDLGAKFGLNYQYEPTNHTFRIIKMRFFFLQHSVVHPYQLELS